MWDKSRPIAGTATHAYLRSWGFVNGEAPTVRHYELTHPGTGEILSSLIGALVTPGGELEAVEQVNLIGPARRAVSRILIGAPEYGGIWLGAPGETVGVTSNIEAGCAIQRQFFLPVVCAALPRRLGQIWLPPVVERVIIFPDDEGPDAGRAAAQSYMRRNYTVEVEEGVA